METNNIAEENRQKAIIFMCETIDTVMRSYLEHNGLGKQEIEEYIQKNSEINFYCNQSLYDTLVAGDMIHPRITGIHV